MACVIPSDTSPPDAARKIPPLKTPAAEMEELPPRRGFDRRWLALAVTSIGSFMTILDGNIVNLALPSILKGFHSDIGRGQLIVTVYLMSLAIVIPVSGFLGDRLGMKRLYMFTLGGFTVTSAFCGLSWGLPSLIGFRALQGLAGGMLQPLGMALVFTMITPLERGKFMPVLGLPTLLAPLIGPTVGGYIVQYFSWRFIFLFNLPVGLAGLALAYLLLKETPMRGDAKLDAKGFGLSAVGFPCLLLGLSEGVELGWTSLPVLTLLGIGLVSLSGFVRVELKHPDPMLRLQLFGNKMFLLAMLIIFINMFTLFGLQYVLPLFLQQVHHVGAATTGQVLLPGGITAFATMTIAGQYYNRLGPRPLVTAGLIVMIVTTLGLSRVGPTSNVVFISGFAALRGVALGLAMPTIQTAGFNCVPEGETSRAAAMVNGFQRMFSSVTTALLTTILITSLGRHGGSGSIAEGTATPGPMLWAFRDAYYAMTAVSVVGLALAFFARDPVLVERDRQSKVLADGILPSGLGVKHSVQRNF
jgi:EmrB/QacA subfamily drug resistance transporter